MKQEPVRLLLVEDEATLRGILSSVLADAGHTITAVATGEEALAVLAGAQFDAVVTDKNLPGITGLELNERLQKDHPGMRMLLVTGYPSVGSAVEALDAGFLSFMVKPFRHLDEAAEEVSRVLAIDSPVERHRRALQLRARLQGDASVAPPRSVLVIGDRRETEQLAARIGAEQTVRAQDVAEAQGALVSTHFSAVVSTEVSALIEARSRLSQAALVLCAEASFADVLELIRLGAALANPVGDAGMEAEA